MSKSKKRKVGERGQITIPKEFRERLGISHGDEVTVQEKDGKLVIEASVTREDLAKGYRQRSEKMEEVTEEMEYVSEEADEALGETPEW
jgi:AbrB family looped-hinge helix DNA binding protein